MPDSLCFLNRFCFTETAKPPTADRDRDRKLARLRRRFYLTLQISLDSPEPARHDRHRGRGTWARAWSGIERARAEEFRVRLAATVSTDTEAE